ncbi:Repeat domain-containing protein [Amycolatopsis xylanica]|uniref:Repeat domain-containing protein n=1 Tax=Amycolatopsis xylanica TaxID=589385 RepID=A0A1H3S9F0_9PSEU|nr:VCBS repeat domain-containing M23 family metallopeptidase [Amycolatopsis xylanica]SDZ34238.1 Repeat domain-containing protein [Amycolatopsis xylanica]
MRKTLISGLVIAAMAGTMASPAQAVTDRFFLPYPAGVTHTVTQGWDGSSHNGSYTRYAVDFGMPTGTTISASAPGVVQDSYLSDGWGNTVVVKHPGGRCTRYSHLSVRSVDVGAKVGQGQQIGLSGATGHVTGPHLDFKVENCATGLAETWSFVEYSGSLDNGSVTGKQLTSQNKPGAAGGAARDLTGNGWDDILARNSSDDKLYLYDGFAPGKLASPRAIGTGWGGTRIVLTGEFTGDADGDILGINTDGDMNLYAGNGTAFSAPKLVGTGWNSMKSVVTADFTGEGTNDLIGIQEGSGDLYLYAGNGNGTFSAPRKLASGWGGQTALVAGDFDNDNHGDLVGRAANGDLNLYRGYGNAQFSAPAKFSNGWNGITALIPGDFTGDGKTDIAGRTSDGTLNLYPSYGTTLGSGVALGTGWNGHNLYQS